MQGPDSTNERLARLARVRAMLVALDEAPKLRTGHSGWLVWAGLGIGALAGLAALSLMAPIQATASAKNRSALYWPTAVPVTLPALRPLAKQIQKQPATFAPAPMIALVIDDIGPARHWSAQALRLPAPVSLAVLPYEDDAPDWSRRAISLGHEVLLHMPMEPVGMENPGPGALLKSLPPAQNQARLQAALKRVPEAKGINNHMGSRFTSCAHCMAEIAPLLRRQGLFFLDSLTSAKSIAANTAEEAGVPTIQRDVFLDDDNNAEAIAVQMRRAEALAMQNGLAVVIAHPRPQTMAALGPWLARLHERGFVLVPAGQALRLRQDQKREKILASARL